jgi:hypothetical protein
VTEVLTIAATVLSGVLAGAAADKAFVQLPARHRIGIVRYADYSRAADLGRGLILYPILGAGAPILTIAAAAASFFEDATTGRPLLAAAAILAVAHVITTIQAAPKMLSLRRLPDQEEILAPVLHAFAQWTNIRAILQIATFLTVLGAALVVT